MTIQSATDAAWTAAKALIEAQFEIDQPETEFYEFSRLFAATSNRAIIVDTRQLGNTNAAVKLLLGELVVTFACMVRSGEPTEGIKEAEDLAYWLADLFMSDECLGGATRTVRVPLIEYDSAPSFELEDVDSADYCAVTVIWEIDYARP